MRIGTRGSALALAQTKQVAQLLAPHLPDGEAPELVVITTTGDRAGETNDKSQWVFELEQALSAGEIDAAVHSANDVAGDLREGLALLGTPKRVAAEDVLCGAEGQEQLGENASVGTSSIRRAAQMRAVRPDVEIVSIRGNVDTRLRKLKEGRFDAIMLAKAGLTRLGREGEAGGALDPVLFVPSPGQGTLALEGRADDERTREAVRLITDDATFAALRAERTVAHTLGASCNTPIGAYARCNGNGRMNLRAWVGLPDGSAWVVDEQEGDDDDPEALGQRVAERLKSAGASELLRRAEEFAVERA
jgi:hydroxymethylbilane synthase